MAEDLKGRILSVTQKLGEALTSNNLKDAYTFAGELNSLLKTEEQVGISVSKIGELNNLIRSYYRINEEMQEHTKKLYGVGKALLDIK